MKKIVFIISSSRSGSTLLCKSLGSHPEGFAASELQNLKRLIMENSHCSCGNYYQNCVFWNSIIKKYNEEVESEETIIPSLEMKYNGNKYLKRLKIITKYLSNNKIQEFEKQGVNNTILIYKLIFSSTCNSLIRVSLKILNVL